MPSRDPMGCLQDIRGISMTIATHRLTRIPDQKIEQAVRADGTPSLVRIILIRFHLIGIAVGPDSTRGRARDSPALSGQTDISRNDPEIVYTPIQIDDGVPREISYKSSRIPKRTTPPREIP